MKKTIFIVDDEESSLFVAENLLINKYKILKAQSKLACINTLKTSAEKIHLILLDLNMPEVKGFELLRFIKKKYPFIPIIMLTYVNDIQIVVDAMKAGADDYIIKEDAVKTLNLRVDDILIKKLNSKKYSSNLKADPDIFIPNHSAYQSVFDISLKFARNGLDFLIQSETGTGKSVLVKYIYNQLKPKGSLVNINCSAIPESLAESESFGHEAGSFTDARETKIGKFEQANNGVLFLDEIGNMPINLQRKILKVIEEKAFSRVGSHKEIKTSFLLISATNEDLAEAVKNKVFRKDLFFRIHKPTIQLPALQDYPQVIPEFIYYFTEKFNREFNQNFKPDRQFLNIMQAKKWDGNIRDLQKSMRIIVACYPDQAIINNILQSSRTPKNTSDNLNSLTLDERVNEFKTKEILKALKACSWNVVKTAQNLGIKRPTLIHQMEKLGINKNTY